MHPVTVGFVHVLAPTLVNIWTSFGHDPPLAGGTVPVIVFVLTASGVTLQVVAVVSIVIGAAAVCRHVVPWYTVPTRTNVWIYWNACVVLPDTYHAGRVHDPLCVTHGPFCDPVDCAVSNATLPSTKVEPSSVGRPDNVWLLVATAVTAGFTDSAAFASVTTPAAIVVATVPDDVVTSPVRAGINVADKAPDVMLLAFVVSVVALAARPVMLPEPMLESVLALPLIVLFVRVCVSLVPTTAPDGAATADAVPLANFNRPLDALKSDPVPPTADPTTPPAILLPLRFVIELLAPLSVLFVSVCVSVVPTIAPDGAVTTDAVPLLNLTMPLDALKSTPVPPRAGNRTPLAMFPALVVSVVALVARPATLAFGKDPVTPPLPVPARLIAGMSAPTRARRAMAPDDPFGLASTLFCVCPLANVTASVPLEVIGDPATLRTEGTVIETLVTVPLPPPPPPPAPQVPSVFR